MNEEVNVWEHFCPTDLSYSITLWASVCNSIRQIFLLGGSSKLHPIHPDLEALINISQIKCNNLGMEAIFSITGSMFYSSNTSKCISPQFPSLELYCIMFSCKSLRCRAILHSQSVTDPIQMLIQARVERDKCDGFLFPCTQASFAHSFLLTLRSVYSLAQKSQDRTMGFCVLVPCSVNVWM